MIEGRVLPIANFFQNRRGGGAICGISKCHTCPAVADSNSSSSAGCPASSGAALTAALYAALLIPFKPIPIIPGFTEIRPAVAVPLVFGLLFGMGRDGVIPRRVFGRLNPRYSTPSGGIYVMGAVSLLGAFSASFQSVAELLNFGAFAGFILVNLSVIRHYYFRLGQRRGRQLLSNLIFPLLGAVVCTYVWMSLSRNAKLVGFAWLALDHFSEAMASPVLS